MIYAKTISLVAALALASQAVAEPLGKGRLLVSTRDMFGLEGRSDATYKPKTAVCGLGSDCSACGSAFAQCSSDDQYIHCYDTSSNATCCADGSGGSCESGYYCYPSRLSKTLCCPDGIDADSCKSTYGATLTSILPTSSATSASTATSSTASTSSATSTISAVSSSTASAFPTGGVVRVASGTISPSGNNATNATATYSKSSATTTLTGTSSSSSSSSSSSASSTSTSTSTSGAVHNAASFLALFGAAIMATML